jgi:hypothetical protein
MKGNLNFTMKQMKLQVLLISQTHYKSDINIMPATIIQIYGTNNSSVYHVQCVVLPNFSKHIQGSSKITKGKGLKRSGGFTMKVDQSTDIVSLSVL